MNRCVLHERSAGRVLGHWAWLAVCLALLTGLTGCGTRHTHQARSHYNPSRYYPPPGPASDPWGPYIHEASGRFGVPELWVRRVMRQESGGQEDVISWAGAMGLMQVMPDTYSDLRDRYNLGDDPFDPHNNILAGTAYLREMYDRYGAPGFLAAYNAGPNRLDSYLNGGRALPVETINYVASIAPLLGAGTPMSGPLAVYAGGPRLYAEPVARASPLGCDPDAAYNPDGACTPLRPAVMAAVASDHRGSACDPDAAYDPTAGCQRLPAVAAAVGGRAPAALAAGCDPDAAFDPYHPCVPLRPRDASGDVIAQALSQPGATGRSAGSLEARPIQEAMARPTLLPGQPSGQSSLGKPSFGQIPLGRWAIQVGAFANLTTAQAAAERARSAAPDILRQAKVELPPTAPLGTQVAFRARLFGLSSAAAADACSRLSGRGVSCLTVPPSRDSF